MIRRPSVLHNACIIDRLNGKPNLINTAYVISTRVPQPGNPSKKIPAVFYLGAIFCSGISLYFHFLNNTPSSR